MHRKPAFFQYRFGKKGFVHVRPDTSVFPNALNKFPRWPVNPGVSCVLEVGKRASIKKHTKKKNATKQNAGALGESAVSRAWEAASGPGGQWGERDSEAFFCYPEENPTWKIQIILRLCRLGMPSLDALESVAPKHCVHVCSGQDSAPPTRTKGPPQCG